MNIDPRKIEFYIPADYVLEKYGHPRLLRELEVVNSEILQHKLPILGQHKIKYCFEHFISGVPWHELAIESAPMERYWQLDAIFAKAKVRRELEKMAGENILIHMINGEPYFAGGGFHRLAIALILGLTEIPVDISLICTTKGGECEN